MSSACAQFTTLNLKYDSYKYFLPFQHQHYLTCLDNITEVKNCSSSNAIFLTKLDASNGSSLNDACSKPLEDPLYRVTDISFYS